jgi:outer membrane scaffolding protein for murein synthesis (MipA/OmpV family)
MNHRLAFLTTCAVVALSQNPGVALAEDKPLWELGLGVADLLYPAYRGSSETRNYVLPMPLFVYRGQFLRADKDGVRGIFFDSERVEMNLSLAASPPVSSRSIAARQDMPDLKPSVEVGPSLDFKLWQSPSHEAKVRLFLPLRGAFTVEKDAKFIGWQFTPRINVDIDNPPGLPGWTLGMLAGPIYGSAKQHDYFYSVAPQYATAQRPAYEAKSGYAGTQLLSALWKRYPAYWVGGFVRYDNLRGSVFEDSPLVAKKSGFAGGVAISWVLGESSTRVKVD